ncbi:MotE family protein [Planktotalea sp.]|uniref:MotE family protein n=1 Tax=Planktotalea sp. TaxID=2029877 RepID=UPI003D6A229D
MQKNKTRKIGSLTVIATLLLVSAGLRLVGVSTAAFALDAQVQPPTPANGISTQIEETQEMDALLESFQAREEKLEIEERRISVRLDDLGRAEKEIIEKLEQLTRAEERLRSLLAVASTASEDDVSRLTAVYENMKAKDAAVIFEEMEPGFAAGFLARMRSESAAAVMSSLSAKSAYAISVVLAGRHSDFREIDPN